MKPFSHKCGCEIVDFDRDIKMCPLHASSDRMLEALTEAVDLITTEYCSHSDRGPCGPDTKECYAYKQYQAIAVAQGKP